MDVGVRELRDGLSKLLAEVRAGHTLTVTDHGKPVARIVPAERLTKLEELIAEGRVSPALQRKQPAPAPLEGGATVSDLVNEQRG